MDILKGREGRATCLEKELLFTVYSTFSFLSVNMINLNIDVPEEENPQASYYITKYQRIIGEKRMTLVYVKNLFSFVAEEKKREARTSHF